MTGSVEVTEDRVKVYNVNVSAILADTLHRSFAFSFNTVSCRAVPDAQSYFTFLTFARYKELRGSLDGCAPVHMRAALLAGRAGEASPGTGQAP